MATSGSNTPSGSVAMALSFRSTVRSPAAPAKNPPGSVASALSWTEKDASAGLPWRRSAGSAASALPWRSIRSSAVEPVEQPRGQRAQGPVAGDLQVLELVQPPEIPRRQRDERGVPQPDGRDFRELRRRHVVAAIHRGVVDALDDLLDHRPAAPADAPGGQRRRAVHLVGRAGEYARGRGLHRRAGGIGDRAADVDRVESRPGAPDPEPDGGAVGGLHRVGVDEPRAVDLGIVRPGRGERAFVPDTGRGAHRHAHVVGGLVGAAPPGDGEPEGEGVGPSPPPARRRRAPRCRRRRA